LQLDYKVDQKKLKQVFKLAGKVISVDLSLDKDGNSRGFAVVEFDHPVEAVQAISMFDRQMLFDRRMTVRLDRLPDKSEGIKLPEGLKAIGIGLGPNGEPLRDVARNLPNVQNNPSQNIASNMAANMNPLTSLSNSLSQLQNVAPAPVQAPTNSSLLGPIPNNSNLSGLAALSNVVGGLTNLSNVGALSNPLLSSAAASLNSLGINLSGGNNDQMNQSSNMGQSSFNSYNTSSGYNSNNRNDDMSPYGGNQIRNYNTSSNNMSNDDYGGNSRFGGGGSSNNSRKQPSDTILVRNVSMKIF
jgi:RNA recognition motif-containing protein